MVAVIVTHHRPVEMQRLLEGLAASQVPLAGCVISDHAPGGETRKIAGRGELNTLVLDDPANPGPGAGWANAAEAAFRHFPEADALWFLDDDVVIAPGTLGLLLEDMTGAEAEAIAPLLTDAGGHIWAFPEPEPRDLRQAIRLASTPAEALATIGSRPVPFCWCTGACLLVARTLLTRAGLHRRDFWILGEDLEYSMRLAATGRAVFTCRAVVPHLPPEAPDAASARRSDYIKFCSLLQNLCYLGFHSPHSRHMKSYLPGNFRRFFRSHGWRPRTWRDAAQCFWQGAVKARPAGTPAAGQLRARIATYDF